MKVENSSRKGNQSLRNALASLIQSKSVHEKATIGSCRLVGLLTTSTSRWIESGDLIHHAILYRCWLHTLTEAREKSNLRALPELLSYFSLAPGVVKRREGSPRGRGGLYSSYCKAARSPYLSSL
jgi:hypothetical protein